MSIGDVIGFWFWLRTVLHGSFSYPNLSYRIGILGVDLLSVDMSTRKSGENLEGSLRCSRIANERKTPLEYQWDRWTYCPRTPGLRAIECERRCAKTQVGILLSRFVLY